MKNAQSKEELESLFDDDSSAVPKKGKITWSPQLIVEPQESSASSMLDRDAKDAEDVKDGAKKSKSGRKKKNSGKSVPSVKENLSFDDDTASSISFAPRPYFSSLEGWVIFIICVLLVVFSISDYGFGDWYRGNGSINRLLINRGFLTSYSTEEESKQAAKDLLKKYVQMDSKIFERPFDGSARGVGADVLTLNDGISDKSTNNGLLLIEIKTPQENAIIDKDSAQLTVHASGAALAALNPDMYAIQGGGALPETRMLRINARLDGFGLNFISGDSYEIGLRDTVQISIDLLDHGLLEPQALTGVHLLELELVLEAVPEYAQGRIVASSSASTSEVAMGMGVLAEVSATTSVAFLFLNDQAGEESEALSAPEGHTQIEAEIDTDTRLEEMRIDPGTDTGTGTGTGTGRHLKLLHPEMDGQQRAVTLPLGPSAEESVIEVLIELAPSTLLQEEEEEDKKALWVLFSVGADNHVDITHMVREQLRKGGQSDGIASVLTVPVGLRGVLGLGTHNTAVTLVQTSREAQQEGALSAGEVMQTGRVLASSNLQVTLY